MDFFKRLFKSNDSSTINIPDEIRQDEFINENVTTDIEEKPSKAVIEIEEQSAIKSTDNVLTIDEKNELIESLAKGEESTNNLDLSESDPLLEDAARLIVQNQIGSTSLIQRRMKLGYNRAGRLMDQLERIGIVGPNLGSASREVRFKTELELEQFIQNGFQIYKVDLKLFYDENRLEIEEKKLQYQRQKQEENLKREKEIIRQELLEKERKRQLQREVLKELEDEGVLTNQIADKEWSREPIPQDVMDKVWNRDAGKCVKCGSQEHLEFDHIIPFSKGGANTYRNLQILCKKCNIEKSNKIG